MWMASRSATPQDVGTIQQYRMHVSQKYIDLTRQKLRLTRLPKDPPYSQPGGEAGVSKMDIEPLIDDWLERYDWREREAYYNETLPQFRVSLNGTRLHFVHKKSGRPNAIPLLFVHGWPESFLGVSKIIDELSNPVEIPSRDSENKPAFDVVAPSIPGCGFSDAMQEENNNAQATADVLNALMLRLGYLSYFAHGSGWGFTVCRLLALRHSDSCIAIHTVNPSIPPPQQAPQQVGEPLPLVESRHLPLSMTISPPLTPGATRRSLARPQTDAIALCDSPAGLLALMVDKVLSQPSSGQHSPARSGRSPAAPVYDPWMQDGLLDWTMIHWLPGPETALRWLVHTAPAEPMLWTLYSNVPLGVTYYSNPNAPPGEAQGMASWAGAYHHVVMMRPRAGNVKFAAWERPEDVTQDIRELARMLSSQSL